MIKLRWYQREMVQYGLKVGHPAFFVEMRLGKTIPVIRLCKHWKNTNSVLIVAPYAAFMGWRDDLKKEGEEPAIELSTATEQRKTDLFAYWPTTKYFMISKEGFLFCEEIKDMPWDVVILDESTFIKNPKPQVTKFFVNNFRNVKHRVVMTGLPDPQGPLDYFYQLQFLNPEILKENNYWDFRNKHFMEVGYDWDLSRLGRKYLSQRLAKHCYFMTRKEAGVGSEKIYSTRLVEAPKKILKVYNTLKEEFIFEYKKEFKVTKYATVKFNWMRKLLGGVFDGKSLWDGKCEEIKYLVNGELRNQPLIIYCQYIDEIKHVQNYFNKYFKKRYKKNIHRRKKIDIIYGDVPKPKREKLIKDFQKGRLDWLIVQPVTTQYAVDFSRSRTFIYYSMPPREVRAQSEDRGISAFVDEPLLLIDLIVPETVEEQLYTGFKLKESATRIMRRTIKAIQKDGIK